MPRMKFNSILSRFKPKSRADGWFCVALAPAGVYLAQVRFVRGVPKVVRAEYRETGPLDGHVLQGLAKEGVLGSQRYTTLLAPGDYQMTLVEAPNVPAQELKSAVRWKIKDHLSYHIDDATVDVVQIPAHGHGDRPGSAFAVSAENDIIKNRIEQFQHAELDLNVIDIPEMAQRNVAALFEEAERALAMLSVDDYGALLTITSAGELFFSRRIEIGAEQLTSSNEDVRMQARDRVELELQRSLDYFDRQYNHLPISRVLVCAPEESQLQPFLASGLEARVDALVLAEGMDIDGVPELSDCSFVCRVLPALGAAMRQEG